MPGTGARSIAPTVPRRALRKEPALIAICLLLLLLATVPPLVNLHRFQARIAGVISRSIGRPVSMDSVALQLLPWPGLRISNLQVEEDPAFGAEPALHAPQVVAELRLSSLWRGRFEPSRVEITDASVNLVRDPNGRWNIGSVLLEASHVRNAPTTQSRPGPAPRFPYIEATGTRINIKLALEKLPYSLLNADFSMSLAQPEVWRLKLEGQPVRTDLELFASDTGTLRLEGELHRASAFGTMPLEMEATWTRLPLGQASRMLLGRDGGWRGDVDLQARFRGEIDALDVRTHILIANLHRQEFAPEQPFNVDATCDGHGSRSRPAENTVRCRWPLGRGGLTLARSAQGWTLEVEKVPASVVFAAVGLLRPGALPLQQAGGEFDGSYQFDPGTRRLTGVAAAPEITVANLQTGLPFTVHQVRAEAAGSVPTVLRVTADPLPMGLPDAAVLLSSEVWSGGYSIHAAGSATLEALRPVFGALHVTGFESFSADPAGEATVRLAVTRSGTWIGAWMGAWMGAGTEMPSGTPPGRGPAAFQTVSETTGTAHLEHVLWRPAFLPFPVAFASADATLAPGWLRWSSPGATFGTEPNQSAMSVDAEVPLGCELPDACVTQFTLRAATLDARTMQAAFESGETELSAFMDRFGRFNSRSVQLPAMEGTLHAGVLTLGRLPVHEASLVLAAGGPHGGSVELRSFDGGVLGGTVHLQGSAAGSAPRYALHGSVEGVSAKALAALWDEDWGPGTLGGTLEVAASGRTAGDLTGSAQGSFHAAWLHGDWSHDGLKAAALSRFPSWDGGGQIGAKGLEVDKGALSGTGAALTGIVGWDRTLALQLVPAPEAKPVAVGGTLAVPVESAAP